MKYTHVPYKNKKLVLKILPTEDKNGITSDIQLMWIVKTPYEDVIHVISICSVISSRYLFPLQRDVVAKYVFRKVKKSSNPNCVIKYDGN